MPIRIIHVGVGGRGRHWLDFVAQHPDFTSVACVDSHEALQRRVHGQDKSTADFLPTWQRPCRRCRPTRCSSPARRFSMPPMRSRRLTRVAPSWSKSRSAAICRKHAGSPSCPHRRSTSIGGRKLSLLPSRAHCAPPVGHRDGGNHYRSDVHRSPRPAQSYAGALGEKHGRTLS